MKQSYPLWLEIALKEIGTKEVPSRQEHNPRIVEYHATTKLKATQDEVPWCSSYLNWVMQQSGIEGTGSAAAASWGSWGTRCGPALGAITLLKFDTSTNPSGMHVGFLWWVDSSKLLVLGGNQKDQVNITSYNPSRLLGFRWPSVWMTGLPVSESGRKVV